MQAPQPKNSRPAPAKRQSKACRRCTKRKQRCHGFPVCSNCEQAGQACEHSEFARTLHRRDDSRAALDRIQNLEAQLAKALADLSEVRRDQSGQQHEASPAALPIHSYDTNSGRSPGRGPAKSTHFASQQNDADADEYPAACHTSNHAHPTTSMTGPAISASLEEIVQATVWTKALSSNLRDELPLSLSLKDLQQRSARPPSDTAGRCMLKAYFDQIHPRYPFLDRCEIAQLHSVRHHPRTPNVAERFGTFKLYMVYAIGSTILQRTGSQSDSPPETYFMAAMQHMSAAKESHTLQNIEAMTLLVLYNLRSSFSSGIWYMTGLAMRTCNDLELHREFSYPSPPTYRGELQRRLFWSVYLLERAIALSLKRPFCIAEQDIDTCLPCDVDDFVRDDGTIAQTLQNRGDGDETSSAASNLTMWIHFIQVKRIESHIHAEVYCLNKTKPRLLAKIDPLLSSLDAWHRGLPSLSESENEYLNLHWNKATLLILRPFLNLLRRDDPRIRRCLSAAGEICGIFQRMHQRDSYGHSFVSVHSIFIAGITMCYCLFLDPNLFSSSVSNNLRACSSTMFVMAERASENKKHRDVLEDIVSRATASTDRDFIISGSPTSQIRQPLSRYDILAVQNLMNLSAGQDPSTVPTPEARPAEESEEESSMTWRDLGVIHAPSMQVAANDCLSANTRTPEQDLPLPRIRKTVAQNPSQGFMDTLDNSDLFLAQDFGENDPYNVQMMRELMSGYGRI